jgi:hypothetical protein
MVAPSLTDLEASAADSLSTDTSRPMSPELRMKASPLSPTPSTSSDHKRLIARLVSVMSMRIY